MKILSVATSKSKTYLAAEVFSFENIKIEAALHINFSERDVLVLRRPSSCRKSIGWIFEKNIEKQLLPATAQLPNIFNC